MAGDAKLEFLANARHCLAHARALDQTTGKQYLMQDDEFEWDDKKAALNLQRHGVTFLMARDCFRDAFGIEWPDELQGTTERRFVMLGMVEDRLLFVSYAAREDRIRIISARKAQPHERRRYHDENSPGHGEA